MKGKMTPGLAKAAKAKKTSTSTSMGSSGASGKMSSTASAKGKKSTMTNNSRKGASKSMQKYSKMAPGMMPKAGAMKKAKSKR